MSKQPTRILTVGGGSGGHVTPVISVIEELTKYNDNLEIRFWCDKGFFERAESLFIRSGVHVKLQKIVSGKLRRYHGVSIWRQLADVPTLLRNIRDTGCIVIGFLQSILLLIRWRPHVVFCKGGFVCLPVGYAASMFGIPLVIHDSDAHPGLTNRLLARKARFIATGAPLEYYKYPKKRTFYTGLPVKSDFLPASKEKKQEIKRSLRLPPEEPLVVIIGGGLGAKTLNDACVAIAEQLLQQASVVHISGNYQYNSLREKVPGSSRYILKEFVSDGLAGILAAADVIVTRGGASALAEAAAVGAVTIIVPNDKLVGDHQTKNAAVFKEREAAIVLRESEFVHSPEVLLKVVKGVLNNPSQQAELSRNIQSMSRPHAAKDVAKLILQVVA